MWPITCFVNAVVTGEQAIDGVLCIEASRLARVLADYGSTKPTLDHAAITHIHGIARRSTTWMPV